MENCLIFDMTLENIHPTAFDIMGKTSAFSLKMHFFVNFSSTLRLKSVFLHQSCKNLNEMRKNRKGFAFLKRMKNFVCLVLTLFTFELQVTLFNFLE